MREGGSGGTSSKSGRPVASEAARDPGPVTDVDPLVDQVALGDEGLSIIPVGIGSCVVWRHSLGSGGADINGRRKGQAQAIGIVFVVFVLAIIIGYLGRSLDGQPGVKIFLKVGSDINAG